MASTVMSETQAHTDRTPRLSLNLDVPTSASPYPSPSSSFLPPPMPGAHEFAVKPPPAGRNARKMSIAQVIKNEDENNHTNGTAGPNSSATAPQINGTGPRTNGIINGMNNNLNGTTNDKSHPPSPTLSPVTPTPFLSTHVRSGSSPRADTSSFTTPIAPLAALPDSPGYSEGAITQITIPEPPSPTTNTTNPLSSDTLLPLQITSEPSQPTSTRPAPPSPATSRRASAAPSSFSSRSSRPPSTSISRANSNSQRHSGPGMSSQRSSRRFSSGIGLPPASPVNTTFPPPTSTSTAAALTSSPNPNPKHPLIRVRIKVRDYGFSAEDDRHKGVGPDVPKANKIGRINRRLGATVSMSSSSSSTGDGEEEKEEEEDEVGDGAGWDRFRSSLGRLGWIVGGSSVGGSHGSIVATRDGGAGQDGFPSKMDLDMNFRDEDEGRMDGEGQYDGQPDTDGGGGELYYMDEDEEEDDEVLYPGLYRAVYAFEPEGTAEMRLEEDQIVRVIGRGGGVGWAVVVDESKKDAGEAEGGKGSLKHALVPESYLEPVRLDWEESEDAQAQ